MAFGGAALRFGAIGLRILQFACSAIALGIYSYFLAVLSRHDTQIPQWQKGVEGIVGSATLYTIFGILFTLFLGGKAFFGFLAIGLDIAFAACFVAVAFLTRHGANSCTGIVETPLGTAPSNEEAPGAGDYGYVCRLNTAVFAVALINVFLFVITAGVQFLLVKHHRKEKRYGPGPDNNYTSGKSRFWHRKRADKGTRDAELATSGGLPPRVSHETGTTIGAQGTHAPVTSEPKYGQPGYGNTTNY